MARHKELLLVLIALAATVVSGGLLETQIVSILAVAAALPFLLIRTLDQGSACPERAARHGVI